MSSLNLQRVTEMTEAEFDRWYQRVTSRRIEKEKRWNEQNQAAERQFATRSEKLSSAMNFVSVSELLVLVVAIARVWWAFLLIGLAFAVVVPGLYFTYSYLWTGVTSQYEPPKTLPTARSVPTDRPRSKAWSNVSWLTVDEAKELRSKDGVLNLAYLDGRSVRYARDMSVELTRESPWVKVIPPGFTALTIKGTAVEFVFEGYTYILNVGQPFTSSQYPEVVWAVDSSGTVWMVSDDTEFQSLSDVAEKSVYRPRPNERLSLTLP